MISLKSLIFKIRFIFAFSKIDFKFNKFINLINISFSFYEDLTIKE